MSDSGPRFRRSDPEPVFYSTDPIDLFTNGKIKHSERPVALGILEAIRSKWPDWRLLHSLRFFSRGKRGETDFVLVTPDPKNAGRPRLIIIEVKGGQWEFRSVKKSVKGRGTHERRGFRWVEREEKGVKQGCWKRERSDPYSQLERAHAQISTKLNATTKGRSALGDVSICRIVWFTSEQTKSRDVDGYPYGLDDDARGMTLLYRDLYGDIPEGTKDPAPDPKAIIEGISKVLGNSSNVKNGQAPLDDQQSLEFEKQVGEVLQRLGFGAPLVDELWEYWKPQPVPELQLTDAQSIVMKGLTDWWGPAAVVGRAGSGKSLLALRACIQIAERGRSVALVCSNAALAERAQAELEKSQLAEGTGALITVLDFSKQIPGQTREGRNLQIKWPEGLQRFDAVVFDDAHLHLDLLAQVVEEDRSAYNAAARQDRVLLGRNHGHVGSDDGSRNARQYWKTRAGLDQLLREPSTGMTLLFMDPRQVSSLIADWLAPALALHGVAPERIFELQRNCRSLEAIEAAARNLFAEPAPEGWTVSSAGPGGSVQLLGWRPDSEVLDKIRRERSCATMADQFGQQGADSAGGDYVRDAERTSPGLNSSQDGQSHTPGWLRGVTPNQAHVFHDQLNALIHGIVSSANNIGGDSDGEAGTFSLDDIAIVADGVDSLLLYDNTMQPTSDDSTSVLPEDVPREQLIGTAVSMNPFQEVELASLSEGRATVKVRHIKGNSGLGFPVVLVIAAASGVQAALKAAATNGSASNDDSAKSRSAGTPDQPDFTIEQLTLGEYRHVGWGKDPKAEPGDFAGQAHRWENFDMYLAFTRAQAHVIVISTPDDPRFAGLPRLIEIPQDRSW